MQHRDVQLSGVGGGPGGSGRRQAGYTLIELLVGIVISLLALGTFLTFNRFQLFALTNQSAQIDLQTAGRSIVDLFAREVRRAGYDPTCSKTFPAIAAASANSIEVESDLNGDGSIDATNEDVTYTYDPTTHLIERTAGGSTSALTDSGMTVTGSTLQYYDSSGNLITPGSTGSLTSTQLTSVRRVRIVLALQASAVDPQNTTPLVASFSSNVDLRNRYFLGSTACP